MVSKIVFVSALLKLSLSASVPIDKIVFEGNDKVTSKRLNVLVQSYIGKPMEPSTSANLVETVESFYRKHNFSLAYASIGKNDEYNRTVTVKIGKYGDFNARSIAEMERRPLIDGKISRIFFSGNEKISTRRLIRLVEPYLGMENIDANRKTIQNVVQEYYRSNRFELAYAQTVANEQGIVTVEIKKYPTFKEKYAQEGKN